MMQHPTAGKTSATTINEAPPHHLQVDFSQKQRRKSRAGTLHQLWKISRELKLIGFFEIDRDHQFYDFTCMLKEGLKAAILEAMDNTPKANILCEADFNAVLKQAHKGFEMKTYAGPAFARFRDFLGLEDSNYLESLSCRSAYLQFISNSKSTADFFLTHDKHYFLKTQSKREAHFLLSKLAKYFQHMERYPHSLLVKFLGVHSIIVPQKKKKYFIIMQSIFYPHERIVERYDIKGCQLDRWEQPAPEDSRIIMILKDLNFAGKTICLDDQRAWFVHQVKLDTQFLEKLAVMDYSLLVAFQPLHEDEQNINRNLATIIDRVKRSVNMCASSLCRPSESLSSFSSDMLNTSKLDQISNFPHGSSFHEFIAYYMMHKSNANMSWINNEQNDSFFQEALLTYLSQVDSSEQLPKTLVGTDSHLECVADSLLYMAQNRRLLPNSRNPLHVIDGPKVRYFVGIIDLFTVYSFRKKLEHLWKSIRYRGQNFSTVSPSHYARRLCQWVEEHTT